MGKRKIYRAKITMPKPKKKKSIVKPVIKPVVKKREPQPGQVDYSIAPALRKRREALKKFR